jgi:hypothetical protein
LHLYQRLLRNLERDQNYRHIALESQKRIAAIGAGASIPPTESSETAESTGEQTAQGIQ